MARVWRILVGLLIITVACAGLTCCVMAQLDDDCCRTVGCALCEHSVVSRDTAPLPSAPFQVIANVTVVLLVPESPDLAPLSPPPNSCA